MVSKYSMRSSSASGFSRLALDPTCSLLNRKSEVNVLLILVTLTSLLRDAAQLPEFQLALLGFGHHGDPGRNG